MFRNKGNCRFAETCKYEHSTGEPIAVPDRTDQPRGICYNFRDNGECKFADRCRFSHGDDEEREKRRVDKKKTKKRQRRRKGPADGTDGQPKPAGEAKTRASREFRELCEPRELLPKVLDSAGKEVCRNFRNKGECRFGAECHYSHEAGEPIPEPARGARRGRGRRGRGGRGGSVGDRDGGGDEKKRTSAPKKPQGPGQCYNFQENGSCEYGNECRFKHGENDTRDLAASRPRKPPGLCYNFRDNGTCEYGDKCKYSHDLNAADDAGGDD